MPTLRYADNIRNLPECPPGTCEEKECAAFRFVRDPVDAASFVAPAIATPKRVFRQDDCCKAYGLSMFQSERQARARFAQLLSRHSQIRARIGTHLASVKLAGAHGTQSDASADGHFTLHEYVGADFVSVATLVGAL